jgi:Domain of unknown function (DUF4349)
VKADAPPRKVREVHLATQRGRIETTKVARRFNRMGAVRSAIVLSVFLLLALSACGGREDATQSGGEAISPDQRAKQAAPAVPGKEVAASETDVSQGWEAQQDFGRKIIKTAELGIRAEKVRDSAARAQQIAAQFGGSVLSSQVNQGDGYVSADLVLVIPSPEFEKALGELRGLGKEVTTDTVTGVDVTDEFVDLQSRERNLEAAEQSLLKLYDEADSVSDTLSIERELTNVRGQIEQVQGRIKYLEQHTASSQISLSVQPVARPAASQPAWDPARVVAQAWNASLSILQALATAGLSVIVFGWWLVPVLLVGFVWWRRRNRGSSPTATDS